MDAKGEEIPAGGANVTVYDNQTGEVQSVSLNELKATEVYVFKGRGKDAELATNVVLIDAEGSVCQRSTGAHGCYRAVIWGPRHVLKPRGSIYGRIKPGDVLTVVGINRATGHTGVKEVVVPASGGGVGSIDIPVDLELYPAVVEVKVEREYEVEGVVPKGSEVDMPQNCYYPGAHKP